MTDRQARPFPLVGLFAATIFLSAFLLFQVQPMISKYILPWFGSTPGVWATALLFFQLMLLAGYAYAHFVVSRFSWRRQALVHAALLGLALIALPIIPAEALKPTGPDAPVGRILLILTLTVGPPFFLLSATAPLLQRWFAQLHPGRSPYRFYALSNFGSLLALLSYPFVIEAFIRLQAQIWIWSAGYVVFAGLCAACAWQLYRSSIGAGLTTENPVLETVVIGAVNSNESTQTTIGKALLWLSLSACGSGLLMATTNQMSLDIAAIPFLWIAPLSLYLLSFILCFDSERWYVRPLFAALLPLALINAVRILYGGIELGIVDQILGYSLTLFVCCMCCHGELARLRPAPAQLTFFFLIVSAGGALGGVFVALLAPMIFAGPYEFHILLVACYVLMVVVQLPSLLQSGLPESKNRILSTLSGLCWMLALAVIVLGAFYSFTSEPWYHYGASSHLRTTFEAWQTSMLWLSPFVALAFLLVLEIWRRKRQESLADWWSSGPGVVRLAVCLSLTLGLFALSGGMRWQILEEERRMVERDRNFYGVLAIKQRAPGSGGAELSLTHGRIRHGQQLSEHLGWPTAYYGPKSGVGVASRFHPARADASRQFRVGVVGLGVGTMAAYANTRIDPELTDDDYVLPRRDAIPDYLRFYELNPLVVEWAHNQFTFLGDAASRGADIDVFLGDARIVLEGQLRRDEAQRFDLLAIDAFSSDAIPIHLLTEESFKIYVGHLQRDGILALHVTNRYVDLIPVVARLAKAVGMNAIYIENYADDDRSVESSDWILLTNNQAFLDTVAMYEDEEPMPPPGPLWTDDFSSVYEIIEF